MNAEQYNAISRPYRENPQARSVLLGFNSGLKYACYVLYPALLLILAFSQPDLLIKEIIVPLILFIAVSIFRYLYNEKRPYEALKINPLIQKNTKGKSFPSRHIFSVFMIAMCWMRYMPWAGVILLICGVFMAYARVVGGVHYPKDVIAGALIAIVGGVLGLWIVPLS